ncbi:MAG: alpha-2-macroglobulin [Elusimicrobia bacterium]|nr:alpha-2-macroglobulin [Elusimicrobiota bacterium]
MTRLFLLAALFIIAGRYPAQAGPTVEQFSPQGLVRDARQVVVRFSEPMVPFGDPKDLAEPFAISCLGMGAQVPEGAGRWADGRNWVFDFDADLPAGLRCGFELKSGAKTLAGKKVGGQRKFEFTTGGPAIRDSNPYESEYSRIDEDQVFVLRLDAPAEESSILEHAHFLADGVAEKIEARLLSGDERRRNLKAVEWEDTENIVLLQAKRSFPPDSVVRLAWEKGIAAKSGVATEADQTRTYKTRPDFTAGLTCERMEAREGCLPFRPISVDFSAPVDWAKVRGAFLQGPKGERWDPEPPQADAEEQGGQRFVSWVRFLGPFPAQADLKVHLPSGITDDASRKLSNAAKFPLDTRTSGFPPLAKFPAAFGIIELNAGAALPVTLRALEPKVKAKVLKVPAGPDAGVLERIKGRIERASTQAPAGEVLAKLSQVLRTDREKRVLTQGSDILVPKPRGADAFEVVGIPLKEPGFYVVELESPRLGASLLGKETPMFVAAAALVTNLSVHFKWGRESSLAWVTSLDRGLPVQGAEVAVHDCNGAVLWRGKSGPTGAARIPPLPLVEKLPECSYGGEWSQRWRLMVSATQGSDRSFVLDSWNDGIEPWRFDLPYEWRPAEGNLRHTVFDRQLLRAGETVHMKHFLRRQNLAGLALPDRSKWPKAVAIEHLGSDQRYTVPLSWAADGTAVNDWAIPKEAKLGTYRVSLPDQGQTAEAWERPDEESGAFRVEEFRVPLLKGSIEPPDHPLVAAQEAVLKLMVRYLAGGPAKGLAVRLRTTVERAAGPRFDAFEDFTFGNGPAGLEMGRSRDEARAEVRTLDLNLDAGGSASAVVDRLPAALTPADLAAELEFRDPNGEVQTLSAKARLWPSGLLVGLKPDSWAVSKEKFKFTAAVADLNGKPVPGVQVGVRLFERKTLSHRKRLVGGFYAYEHSERLVEHGPLCQGATDPKGRLACEAKSPVSGSLIIEAQAQDAKGLKSAAHATVWVAGKDDWWFDVTDSDRMDVIPERKHYAPGETAVLQVRMPFRQALALVTVEREGVADWFVRPLSGKEPVVRLPVKGSYAPNAFVSVLAVRGRVGSVQPTALVDLGRPSYKLGFAELKVGWKAHELKVGVAADRQAYKVREKVRVSLSVKAPGSDPLPAGAEAAVAVVDEGLLELMPNSSWDLLAAMMDRRPLAVRTFTGQMHVVGKRHFGLKALPAGGGGGRQATRELFDTLLYWNPRVPLGKDGKAMLEIPLNDSVTAFRIAAVASSGAGLFGSGGASVRSTQDLALFSGLPPMVREGDRFKAAFTVRNSSDRPLEGQVSAKVDGLGASLDPIAVSLSSGEAREVSWEVTAPAAPSLAYEVTAQATRPEAGAERLEDRLKISQRIVPAVPVRVLQATLAQLDKPLDLGVGLPKGALPGRGGVRVNLSPSLAGDLSGLVEYMRGYPYSCLEQKVSKAVALRDELQWRKIMAELPAYLDGDGLAKFFPGATDGSDALTAYLLSIADEAGWTVPTASRDRMLGGLKGFVEGRVKRWSSMPTVDLALRKLAALSALARHGRAEAPMLQSIDLQPSLWPTSAVLDYIGIFERLSEARGLLVDEAKQILRSRLNFQGTAMGFSTESSDGLWWLMASADLNAVRTVLAALRWPDWKEDLPRLARGALERQRKGHWDLTLANAWGRLALEKFIKAYEADPVAGQSIADLRGKSQSWDWNTKPDGGTLEFAWPWETRSPPEKRQNLSARHLGPGRPWAVVQSLAAVPLEKPFSSGYTVKKTVTSVEQKKPGRWTAGDIARVRLEVQAQADRTWVVVDDPIPAGAAILGTGLGRDSRLSTQGEKLEVEAWPAYQERSFEAFRAYYEFAPKGAFKTEYTVRLNNAGSFHLPPTRVEALYSPEMFGEIPNAGWEVEH